MYSLFIKTHSIRHRKDILQTYWPLRTEHNMIMTWIRKYMRLDLLWHNYTVICRTNLRELITPAPSFHRQIRSGLDKTAAWFTFALSSWAISLECLSYFHLLCVSVEFIDLCSTYSSPSPSLITATSLRFKISSWHGAEIIFLIS